MGRMRDIDPDLIAGAEAVKRTDVLLRDGVEQIVRTLTLRKASGRRGMR